MIVIDLSLMLLSFLHKQTNGLLITVHHTKDTRSRMLAILAPTAIFLLPIPLAAMLMPIGFPCDGLSNFYIDIV